MSDPRGMDRDVTQSSLRTTRGTTTASEVAFTQERGDSRLFPLNRKLVCKARHPLAISFDETGSMDIAPKIFWDKAPLFAGQILTQELLEDPMISLAAHGDIVGREQAPLQFCDFARLPEIDQWLTRLFLEGQGGGQSRESYELVAYFYAYCCEMPNAETPFMIFFGDEDYRDRLSKEDLRIRFGARVGEDLSAEEVFATLKRNFKGNVFFVRRTYTTYGAARDQEILKRWQDLLGVDHVLPLYEDRSVTDVFLGIIAVMSGKMTIKEYCTSMRNRKQSAERIGNVTKSLSVLKPPKKTLVEEKKAVQPARKGKSTTSPKADKKKKVEDSDLDDGKL